MFQEDQIIKEMGIPKPMVLGAAIRNQIPIKENITNVSGVEKFFLGDPEKKKAKNEKTLADAQFTTALANLATQMSADQNKTKTTNNTTTIVVVAVVLIGVFVTAAVLINKKNKAAAVAAPAPAPVIG